MNNRKQETDYESELATIKELKQKTMEAIAPYLERMFINFTRIQELLKLYGSIKNIQAFSSLSSVDDILRLTVVFTHATLEDFLRTLAGNFLPEADEKVLNSIPLAYGKSHRNAEKFFLGKLVQFKGKTVDDVIKVSVQKYLERSNYNNTNEISNLLNKLPFEPSEIEKFYPKLDKLMKRRHQIVHLADRIDSGTDERQEVEKIDVEIVSGWINAVFQFIIHLLPSAATHHLLCREFIKQDGDMFKIGE